METETETEAETEAEPPSNASSALTLFILVEYKEGRHARTRGCSYRYSDCYCIVTVQYPYQQGSPPGTRGPVLVPYFCYSYEEGSAKNCDKLALRSILIFPECTYVQCL